ncbi:hypothetical protein MHBO_001113 [Bonamia ostreae]|uniref:Uncharacterized protein n=1 Tax=Bonamia ostreae TaxID=126728 RepID=A0ABV2AIC6_9EUKA
MRAAVVASAIGSVYFIAAIVLLILGKSVKEIKPEIEESHMINDSEKEDSMVQIEEPEIVLSAAFQ